MTDTMRCLVLGGAGFIGSHLIDALLLAGHQVRCFDRPEARMLGGGHSVHPNFESFEGDFCREADIEAAVRGCDVCYHLVSTTLPQSSNADPVFDLESNLVATVRLLNQAVRYGIKKVVFVSSGGTVYGVPQSVPISESHITSPVCSYGIVKLAIEKYLTLYHGLHGLNYVVLRIANPYGERQRTHANQGAVAVFLGKVLRDEPVEIWGDGSVVRDFVYISDVVDALLLSLGGAVRAGTFNIGSGQGCSLNELLRHIENATGKIAVKRYMPIRSCDVPVNLLSIEHARDVMQWVPRVSLEQGVFQFAEWLKLHPDGA